MLAVSGAAVGAIFGITIGAAMSIYVARLDTASDRPGFGPARNTGSRCSASL